MFGDALVGFEAGIAVRASRGVGEVTDAFSDVPRRMPMGSSGSLGSVTGV